MDSFGLGMLGAVVFVHFSTEGKEAAAYRRSLTIALCCTPVVFIGLGIWMDKSYETYWSLSWITFLWTPLFSFAVLIIVLNCAHRNCSFTRLLKMRPLFYLGTVSYGVYLWHYPVGRWLLKLSIINEMEGYQFPRLALAMFLTSVAIATLSWFVIEARVIALAKSRT
jgi:peptidoglycan/LPS O-acetylase OafA/YrhL